jgi:hypothetical protein
LQGTPTHLHRIAREIMTRLGAFEGSRPLLDDIDALIVRGMSRGEDWDMENLQSFLEDVLEDVGVKTVPIDSEEGLKLLEEMGEFVAERIQASYAESEPLAPVVGPDEVERAVAEGAIVIDPLGVKGMMKTLRDMGCEVGVAIGETKDDIGVFLAAWGDRSGVGPKSVELVVANLAMVRGESSDEA